MVDYFSPVPRGNVWLNYAADVLYVNFTRSTAADDIEPTDDDIILRYDGDELTGFTILHARQRS